MVRTTWAYPLIEQALAAGSLDLLSEVAVLLLAEGEPVQVRTPDQPLDDDAVARGVGQDLGNLRARTVQEFVRITSPVGEHEQITRSHEPHAAQQHREVGRP